MERIEERGRECQKKAGRERRNALTRQRKEVLERRKERLKSVLALALLGRGAAWDEAWAAARALVEKALKLAQQLVADSWDYLSMEWRIS